MPDNALRRLGQMRKPGAWFSSALEGVQETTGPGRQDPGWFHPSALGHPCDAFLAFQFLGAPASETVSARLQRIYDLGSARDLQLKADTAKARISLIKKPEDRQIELSELHIRGELDEWVVNPATGRRYIIDFKTMNNEEFQALEAAKPSHVKQVHTYMAGKETYEAIVHYENKNNQEWKPMPVDFDMNLWQDEIVNRIYRILEGIKKNFVQRTPIPNETSCPFYNICTFANFHQLLEKSELKI